MHPEWASIDRQLWGIARRWQRGRPEEHAEDLHGELVLQALLAINSRGADVPASWIVRQAQCRTISVLRTQSIRNSDLSAGAHVYPYDELLHGSPCAGIIEVDERDARERDSRRVAGELSVHIDRLRGVEGKPSKRWQSRIKPRVV